ncbi:MAG TPA: peptidoglycan-binding protein [Colwellia sp.]|nr:peptidoglycan-binding protein [Colwellia sp.]
MSINNIFSTNLTLIILIFLSHLTYATEYDLPAKGFRLIGIDQTHKVKKGDYFQKIAEQYNVGFLALMAANPDIDPFLPELNSDVVIPSAMLLPYIKYEGIVINLPELRLYYFSPENNKVHVFPVGIGREGLETPKATSYISSKRKNPIWRPTDAMRQRYFEEHGKELPREIAAGPNNPFGKYALRLGTSEYLIHGSNQRFGIGMRASSGCIRLFDDDIKWLFENIPLNTKVRIIEQPIKMSYESDGKRVIEIHSPLSIENTAQKNTITAEIKKFVGKEYSMWQKITPMFDKPKGLAIELGQ